jgi:hypothetical protein
MKERAPLTTQELSALKADGFRRLKLTNEEKSRLREINLGREHERAERAARLRVEEEPIVADLKVAGLDVKSVWDLVNTSTPYPNAIPLLLKHLVLPYPDRIREGIARALAVPDARNAWSLLVSEYKKAPIGDQNGLKLGAKSGLAAALSAVATDEVIAELVSLAKDRSNGSSRLLLLKAFRKSKTDVAKKAIEDLASDPDLAKEIATWGTGSRGKRGVGPNQAIE